MADEKTHRIEIDIPSIESGEPGKLIIDGNDLSKFAHEVRIVLSAGKAPQIQVDLYGIDGIGAKLEEAGLILNVVNADATATTTAIRNSCLNQVTHHRSKAIKCELPESSGMSDPRK